MATDNTSSSPILAFQAPLLNLAYTLTGDRDDAYSLLRDTTRRAMAAPGAFSTRESLFAVMHTIYNSTYSSRAMRRRAQAATRSYILPAYADNSEEADTVTPAGSVSDTVAAKAIAALRDVRHHRAMAMRAAGYRYREIADTEGISILRACLRVILASISLRAIMER